MIFYPKQKIIHSFWCFHRDVIPCSNTFNICHFMIDTDGKCYDIKYPSSSDFICRSLDYTGFDLTPQLFTCKGQDNTLFASYSSGHNLLNIAMHKPADRSSILSKAEWYTFIRIKGYDYDGRR